MMNNKSVTALALLAGSLWLSACGKTASDAPVGDAPSGAGAGSGSSIPGGGNGNTTASNAGTSGGDPFVDSCVPGIPTTSQIPRLLNSQYDAVLSDLLGVTTLAGAGMDGQKPSDQLVADSDDIGAAMNSPSWQCYQTVGAAIAHDVMTGPNKSKFISCDPAVAGCLDLTIKTFGRKAFRRPLTDAELARFQKLGQATPAPTPDELAETTLFAFLVSPSFLLLPELTADNGAANAGFQLSSYEVATRLSFLIWGSIPDDALNAAADADQLQTRDQILAQAQRLVALREKSEPVVTAFHRHWAHMDDISGHWWKSAHDPTQYPLYSSDAKPTYQAELDAFFADVAFGGGSLADLFLSNVSFVNRDNAAIYGLDPAAYGPDLKRVELDAAQRPGFLTRIGFLSSYSSYASTNPPQRGAFLAEDLLGVPIGPPIPAAASTTVMGDFATERAYFDALTASADCQSCHSVINPLGYALENFDGIGKWQTVDARGGQIDATATVDLGDDVTKAIDSPLEFMQQLSSTPRVQRQYAQSWVSYAFKRAVNANDSCVVDDLASKLAGNGYAILDVLPDVTQADSFRMRVRGTQ